MNSLPSPKVVAVPARGSSSWQPLPTYNQQRFVTKRHQQSHLRSSVGIVLQSRANRKLSVCPPDWYRQARFWSEVRAPDHAFLRGTEILSARWRSWVLPERLLAASFGVEAINGTDGKFLLAEYACAQDYRSLKQSSFDRQLADGAGMGLHSIRSARDAESQHRKEYSSSQSAEASPSARLSPTPMPVR